MGFSDVKAQPFVVRLLQNSIKAGRVSSCYLFSGPDGVGKELTAMNFAKALNCERGGVDACNICCSCRKIADKIHPDVNWCYPIGSGRSIRIEQVRDIQKLTSWMPYEGKVKVCIIIDADLLTEQAGNALLKTIEEPPKNTVFILTTSNAEAVLSTIKSRSQEVQYSNLPIDIIMDLLRKENGFIEEEVSFYASLCAGSMGKALRLKNEDVFSRRKDILEILSNGSFENVESFEGWVKKITADLKAHKKSVKDAADDERFNDASKRDAFISGEYQKETLGILELILSWYRDIMVFKITNRDESVFNADYIEQIRIWSKRSDIPGIEEKIKIIEDTKGVFNLHINLKLVFQSMFIRLGLA